MQVVTCAHAQSEHATQRCHNSLRWWNRWGSAGDVMHQKHTEDLGDFEESWRVETRQRTRQCSLRRGEFARYGCYARLEPDEEASIKRLCLSPYVETFNSKLIKRFRTWTNKLLCVFEFRDFYVLSVWTLYVYFAHGINYGYVTEG